MKSLSGLNVSNNPLEFPAQEILDRGISHVLKYLRKCLIRKNQGKSSEKHKIIFIYNNNEEYQLIAHSVFVNGPTINLRVAFNNKN